MQNLLSAGWKSLCVYMLTEEAVDDLDACVKINLFPYLCCTVSRYMNVDAVWCYYQRWSEALSIGLAA